MISGLLVAAAVLLIFPSSSGSSYDHRDLVQNDSYESYYSYGIKGENQRVGFELLAYDGDIGLDIYVILYDYYLFYPDGPFDPIAAYYNVTEVNFTWKAERTDQYMVVVDNQNTSLAGDTPSNGSRYFHIWIKDSEEDYYDDVSDVEDSFVAICLGVLAIIIVAIVIVVLIIVKESNKKKALGPYHGYPPPPAYYPPPPAYYPPPHYPPGAGHHAAEPVGGHGAGRSGRSEDGHHEARAGHHRYPGH